MPRQPRSSRQPTCDSSCYCHVSKSSWSHATQPHCSQWVPITLSSSHPPCESCPDILRPPLEVIQLVPQHLHLGGDNASAGQRLLGGNNYDGKDSHSHFLGDHNNFTSCCRRPVTCGRVWRYGVTSQGSSNSQPGTKELSFRHCNTGSGNMTSIEGLFQLRLECEAQL